MNYRLVHLAYPERGSSFTGEGNLVRNCKSRVRAAKDEDVYKTVDRFRDNYFPHITPAALPVTEIDCDSLLADVINLHNCSGIGSVDRIGEMVEKVNSGQDILMGDGLPNPKLVKTERDEMVLFDGHHSALAYMSVGRKYLSEIPHLLILSDEKTGVSDAEVHAFFGDLAVALSGEDWRQYAINWAGSEGGQLETRRQRNLGELFEALKGKINHLD